MDFTFCILRRNNFILLLWALVLYSCSYYQKSPENRLFYSVRDDSVYIDIKSISVCLGKLGNRDSIPVSIIFSVFVSNETNEDYMFNSSTDYYYRGFAEKKYGKFWMIHNGDSLMLSSHIIGASIIEKGETTMFIPQINDVDFSYFRMELFDFLQKIPKRNYKEYIYNFINNSKFAYEPIVEDYKKELQTKRNRKQRINYPLKSISIKKMIPLVISYTYNCSDYLEEEGETSYYYKDTILVERFWSRIDEWTSNTLYRLKPWDKELKIEKEQLSPIFSLGFSIIYDDK